MKTYPMIAVVIVVIGALLALDYFKPSILLRNTECDTIDSLRVYRFVIQGEPHETQHCYRYETEERVLVYIPRDSVRVYPQASDTIITRTRIRRGGKIGDFNYGLYLRRQGIIGTAYAWRYMLHPCAERREISVPLQKRLYHRLTESGLEGDELATTGALTLGYKEDLDPDLRRRFQASGAAHVLAVSGLHTGIIYTLLMGLLTLGGRVRPRYEDQWGRVILGSVIIVAMWGYAWITGMTPSVVRCVVMVSMVEIGKMVYRNSLTLNTIAASAVLILLVSPLDLWSISFQLSFAATTSIVLIANDLEQVMPFASQGHTFWRKAIRYILGMIVVSLAAQIGTAPITMFTFGQMSNYFLLTNLLVLPIASCLVPCGLACIALGGSGVGIIFGKITYGLAWMMNHAVGWIESLPGSSCNVSITGWMVILLYGAIGMGWMAVHKSLWWLIGVASAVIGFCTAYIILY